MKLIPFLRHLWYEAYYAVASRRLRRYALTCREAVTEMNTNRKSTVRLRLHLSLCQACSNYHNYSAWLRKNIPGRREGTPVDLSGKIFERLKENDRDPDA